MFKNLLYLFFEKSCAFGFKHIDCKSENNEICEVCINKFLDLSLISRKDFKYINEVFSTSPYLNESKIILHEFKWKNPYLAEPIAQILNKFLKIKNMKFDYLIAVPGLKSKERKWITSELLTKELSVLSKIIYLKDFLKKLRETNFHKLNIKGRKDRIKESYSLNFNKNNEKIINLNKNKEEITILLIDDLIASGSTLDKCAELIKQALPNAQIFGITFCLSSF